ncbi:hypothetical protein BURMUCF2_3185 [Burkholderia multivorans CF2]|nr:hypothetical protein BURMUCF2_3185 [Burkholderia multivorans CF2]
MSGRVGRQRARRGGERRARATVTPHGVRRTRHARAASRNVEWRRTCNERSPGDAPLPCAATRARDTARAPSNRCARRPSKRSAMAIAVRFAPDARVVPCVAAHMRV